ncbi:MAG: twin-arginine translocase subunit TatC [Alphaproteobacteria bacterium]
MEKIDGIHMMTLLDHLIELRQRLLVCFLAWGLAFAGCYFFSEKIFLFCVKPLADLFQGEVGRRLIFTGLTEAFMTYLKLSLYASFFLIFPLIAAQIWRFIAPGLYTHEKKVFLTFVLATPFLFLLGACMAYYGVCPLAWKFFLSFEAPAVSGQLAIQLETRVSEYLSLMMKLVMAFGISFQLPILLTLLAKSGLVSLDSLRKNRKYAFLGIVVFAALITPPDLLSPISLAVPLYGLYELSIFFTAWSRKKEIPAELVS